MHTLSARFSNPTIRAFLLCTALSWALLASGQASAEWQLNNDASRLSFVSVKATHVAEVHHFRHLEGMLDAAGNAQISIELASVETNIPIRNERMQTMLFESAFFPTATITLNFEPQLLDELQVGSAQQADLTAALTVRDRSTRIGVSVTAALLNDDTLLVTSTVPVILNADALGLDAGLEKLREVAGLPSISKSVPVSFVLTFDRNGEQQLEQETL